MNNNPWKSIEDAFIPMFAESVEVSGTRKGGNTFKTSVKACVFPVEKLDPFSDVQTDSEVMKTTIYISKSGEGAWSMSFKPQIGDKIVLEDNTAWSIAEDKETQSWYELTLRSKA